MPKKTEEQVITTKEKETILPASPEKLAPTSILTISADAGDEYCSGPCSGGYHV